MDRSRHNRRHIILHDTAKTEKFRSTKAPRVQFVPPELDRNRHASHLLSQLSSVQSESKELALRRSSQAFRHRRLLLLRKHPGWSPMPPGRAYPTVCGRSGNISATVCHLRFPTERYAAALPLCLLYCLRSRYREHPLAVRNRCKDLFS